MHTPVIDLHCDMTVYMIEKKDASPFNINDIGSAIPHLQKGNVIAQVMAFFTPHQPISHGFAMRQAHIFNKMLMEHKEYFNKISLKAGEKIASTKTTLLASIENASGFCHEDQQLDDGFAELERIIELTAGIFYIGFLHMGDNRFGGAAGSAIGLKDDGKILLEYLNNRNITVDLSHCGDKLALDIFNHVELKNLNIPIIASHSNFRRVYDHPRNLTDELAQELIRRKSLIGMNFMKAYLGPENTESIYNHIEYGLKMGAKDLLAFGADFFWDESRAQKDIYFEKYNSASTYPKIVEELSKRFSQNIAEKIAFKNAKTFIEGLH